MRLIIIIIDNNSQQLQTNKQKGEDLPKLIILRRKNEKSLIKEKVKYEKNN